MSTHSYRTITVCFLVAALALAGLPTSWADDLDSVRYGEEARTFAAGSIQQSTPQDGVVNVITGDNQTIGDRMILGRYDVFYLRLKDPSDVAVGDLFTVYKRTRKVFHPATGKYMGYLINRLAIVQVVQVDKELTTARAIRAYGSAGPGDPVMKFSASMLSASDEPAAVPPSEDISGLVVELQADIGLTLVAQRNIVYLDRGSQDGVKAGDRMDLVRYGGGLPPRQVGEVKVLSTEGQSATALVTKSTSRILRGDRFRMKVEGREPLPSPVFPPEKSSIGDLASVSASSKVQNAARETRYSLSDLAKLLHYDSGDATIKPEGYETLDRLVDILKSAPPDQLIRVEGHADNMEIGPSLKSIYPTNWDLSKARAVGVLRYLVEKGGIDSARISSIGYGDTKPVVSNGSEAGRQKNRRVEIVLYSPESVEAPTEQAMKPTDAVDDGYGMPGLGSEKRDQTIPAVDKAVGSDPTKVEQSATVPSASIPNVPPVESSKSEPAASDKPSESSK
jgi:chemotaxis protein MotB